MKQAIVLERGQKTRGKAKVKSKQRSPQRKTAKYALMDAWGEAMHAMKEHGTMPDLNNGTGGSL